MAYILYNKEGTLRKSYRNPAKGITSLIPSAPPQTDYLVVEVNGNEYHVPMFDTSFTSPIGQAQVLERTYTITLDNTPLTSGAWVPINMDGGVGDDISSSVAHTAGTSDFVFQPGIYTIVVQYSFTSLAGGSQQGSLQWYDVTNAAHDGYEIRSTGGATITGVISVLAKPSVATTYELRLNCVSSGNPTTGAGADFFIQIARLG